MTELPQMKTRKRHIFGGVFLVVLVVVAATVVLKRDWIYDWYRGVSYQPSSEMVTIRDELGLTNRGEFLFNAAQPVLNTAADFNLNCRQDESEVAVLGCYTAGNIYIYDVKDAKIAGIRELTTAHELLHANWARMSESEQRELTESLTRVFEANQEMLGEEIDSYDISEKQEELYVRAGTEVKDLPETLEKHFAEIFKDQDKIVDFYESYIVVFQRIKTEMETLEEEIELMKGEIETKIAEYERQLSQLEADIVSFNSCAEVAGCFQNENDFNVRRAALVERQDELNALNDEINELVDAYNEKIDDYNANAMEGRELQSMIDSKAEILKIKQ
ncbi:hypothetical protein [Candidatus Nanosyncoccus alces]|uniref:Uncharacterized protein n=1 Tax=Candidatus Nanosyncoccus alces TaxID=2171997 RepID=A0ABY0FPV2_9BACT|nr:hypothetical protein [Candidatus Nanosyncoccus alces]RYC74875.1 hypothetical protein G3RUM_00424 [Candidatus Nanosyncoccus alces]